MKLKFDVTAKEYQIITDILKTALPKEARVWVFGSRAKYQASRNSDIDLAIDYYQKIDKKILFALEEAFDESLLPYKVDILELTQVSQTFREIIEKQKVALLLPPTLNHTE